MAEPLLVADDGKGLAGESAEENVEIRNRTGVYLRDVAVRTLSEVRMVGLRRVLVPFGGEYAFPPECLIAKADPADTGKEVDEGEPADLRRRKRNA